MDTHIDFDILFGSSHALNDVMGLFEGDSITVTFLGSSAAAPAGRPEQSASSSRDVALQSEESPLQVSSSSMFWLLNDYVIAIAT